MASKHTGQAAFDPVTAGRVQALRGQAATLFQAGKPAEALAVLSELAKFTPKDAQVLAFAALAAFEAGERGVALKFLRAQRKALDKDRGRPESWRGLAGLLHELGETTEAERALAAAVKFWPNDAGLRAHRAELLKSLRRYEACAKEAREAVRLDPGNLGPLAVLAVALHRTGAYGEAAELYRRIIEADPSDPAYYHTLGAALIGAGRGAEAVEVAERWLALEPGHVEALALKGHALQEAGRDAEAAALFDFDRLVQGGDIEVPDGYASMAEFNAALEQHILRHPSLATPERHDLRYHHPKLKITDELLAGDTGPVGELEKAMHAAVRDYLAKLPKDSDHPFVANAPEDYKIHAWAALLDRQGNQNQHVHKDGYLSGCYYVRIPPEVVADANGDIGDIAGGFEVGRPPDEFGCKRAHMIRQYKPHEGLMLLFPAFMYHKTVPFRSDTQRICIAFDVIPA